MSQKRYLQIADFDRQQMYKDRNPIWIKLHCAILDDYEFCALSDETKFHAVALMLLASRLNNKFPDDERWLRGKINANSEINLKLLIEIGFLEVIKGARSATKKSLNDGKSNKSNGKIVKQSEKLREPKQNKTEQMKAEQTTPHHSAKTADAPESDAVCVDLNSFKTEKLNSKNKANGNLSEFTMEDCLRYVNLCITKGDDIRNPKGLATNLFQTGKSDIFIRAAMFPEDQKQADLATYGEPIRFSALPCSVCFGAKMADANGKGFRKCEHCRNERGKSTGLEPE